MTPFGFPASLLFVLWIAVAGIALSVRRTTSTQVAEPAPIPPPA